MEVRETETFITDRQRRLLLSWAKAGKDSRRRKLPAAHREEVPTVTFVVN
jgi:hypothetical protein